MGTVFQVKIVVPIRQDMEHMGERLTGRIHSQGNQTSMGVATYWPSSEPSRAAEQVKPASGRCSDVGR